MPLREVQVRRFEEALELADARGVAHLAERLGLDLADTLARDPELLPNLLQGTRTAVAQAETQFQHLPLAFGQAAKHVAELVLEQAEAGDVERIVGGLVLDEIAEIGALGVAHG